jgi:hypothetical protein
MKLIQDRKSRPIFNYDKQLYCTCDKCDSLFMYGLKDVKQGKEKVSDAYQDHRGISIGGVYSGISHCVEEQWRNIDYISCPVCGEKIIVDIHNFIDGWYSLQETEQYKQYKEEQEKIRVEHAKQQHEQHAKEDGLLWSAVGLFFGVVFLIFFIIICIEGCC